MSEIKMISPAVKNVPWQEKPEGLKGDRSGDTARIRLSAEIL